MRWLVYVEQHGSGLTPGSVGLLSWAAQQGGVEVDAVACGPGAGEAAAGLGGFGAARVLVADDERLGRSDAQPHADVLAALLAREEFAVVLFETTILTSAIAAGLAARLGCGLNWDLTQLELVDGEIRGTRLALGDSVSVQVGWRESPTRLALLRPNLFAPAPLETEAAGRVEPLAVELEEWSQRVEILARTPYEGEGGRPIEDADVLVAGGCGLRSAEDLGLLEELAAVLGGEVAVTMPLVDRRWYHHSAQVGQTGKTVAPRVYIACGLSGAVQHRVGMQGSEVVVAINTDAGAPIFDHCDLGVVGDLYEIVPALTALLRASR